MTMELLEVENLWKIYDKGEQQVHALQEITLTIQKGEMISVMGPSGCGKTTLLNVLSGIDTSSKGSIFLNGRCLQNMKEAERDRFRARNMGFVFQSYNLIPVLSAVENVELPLLSQGVDTYEARTRAEAALARFGLADRAKYSPAELSGGQQQRVALARAIVNRPQIIWADEPTGALDRKTTDMILDLMEELNRTEEVTFIIVTHDPNVAERANRVLYMDSGKIIHIKQNKSTGTNGTGL
ncbi:ABC transporter ATP-binding protein [Sutcliffiella halmapala]|uniref:ABC transporter ATP-binding protein n=1 Tax=Sutcliffiella halmapala TaxID=79882 RepID=UPI001B80C772|nr:ABC transporter ATP-binding protein [Sutcliffiella halmapala]